MAGLNSSTVRSARDIIWEHLLGVGVPRLHAALDDSGVLHLAWGDAERKGVGPLRGCGHGDRAQSSFSIRSLDTDCTQKWATTFPARAHITTLRSLSFLNSLKCSRCAFVGSIKGLLGQRRRRASRSDGSVHGSRGDACSVTVRSETGRGQGDAVASRSDELAPAVFPCVGQVQVCTRHM